MPEGYSGFGAVFEWNGQPVAGLTSIGTPTQTIDALDVTVHGSADGYRDFIGGLANGGEITLSGYAYPNDTLGQIAMMTDFQSKTRRTATMTWPTAIAAVWSATGLITALHFGDMPIDGLIPFSATIQVCGKPTFTVTASGGLTGLTGIEEHLGGALDFVPNFANSTYSYNVAVDTASTWVKFTPTAAGHTITIHNSYDDSTVTVPSGNQSGELDLGAANSQTLFTISAQETGKVAKVYKVYVARP